MEQVTVQYALRHPTGHVDDRESATTFGPTSDLTDAQIRLDIAESDCLCSDDDEPHSLVSRTVTISEWTHEKGS